MGSYIPNTASERQQMLESIGMTSFDDLYADIPEKLRYKKPLSLPAGLSEMEVLRIVTEISNKNTRFLHIFRGAGSYYHYIPSIVKQVTSKEEFVTAYTPYQAEISQGILQSIFEYQTMICELTGMDVSNASVYDGATAAAEALAMCRDRKRKTVIVSGTVDPRIISVVRTYCFGSGADLKILPEKDGQTDSAALNELDVSKAACLLIQSPNYYGIIEDCGKIAKAVHTAGMKLVVHCNPISLALLETPGEYGADIAVGEGQPLGLPMAFGGPYLGFMASKKELMRKLPGRIVGQTVDTEGNRAFVLTLQAREQHIRREKAGSNICSNEALCAMTAAVYMSAMGNQGLKRVADSCTTNAHFLLSELEKIGFQRKYNHEFFHEFVTICPCDARKLSRSLAECGYLSGLPISEREMLWCATEMNTEEEIRNLSSTILSALTVLKAQADNVRGAGNRPILAASDTSQKEEVQV
ncbi:MAG: aminomethyl-transferring glycine dehydrogenase subunit GcvPA [Lachnospiraceae bacterium]|nr:aminomethyl-transferring glycine dehydrogenase subunit GcvPA [Lachnospiraceae bacterium]